MQTDAFKNRILYAGAVLAAMAAVLTWTPWTPWIHEPIFIGVDAGVKAVQNALGDLEHDLARWPQLTREQKFDVLELVIDAFHRPHHISIEKPPSFYIDKLDEAAVNPKMQQLPLERALMILAIMEYDFDNGTDKDELARRALGPDLYESNRLRREAEAHQEGS